MKSILCIVNPVSGLKESLKVYYEVEKKIRDAGFFPNYLPQAMLVMLLNMFLP